MREKLMFFTMICALVAGCADAKFLLKEAIVPAGKATVQSVSSNSHAHVVVNSINAQQMSEVRTIRVYNMTPGNEFIYWARDNSRQVRHVEKDGTFSFLYPRTFKNVKVIYVYGDWGLSRAFNLDPRYDYRWDPETKTFKTL